MKFEYFLRLANSQNWTEHRTDTRPGIRNARHLHLRYPFFLLLLWYFCALFYGIKIQMKCGRLALFRMEPRWGTRDEVSWSFLWDLYGWGSATCTFACPVGGAMRAPETENRSRSWKWSRNPTAFHSWVRFGWAFPAKSSHHDAQRKLANLLNMSPRRYPEIPASQHPNIPSILARVTKVWLLPGPWG